MSDRVVHWLPWTGMIGLIVGVVGGVMTGEYWYSIGSLVFGVAMLLLHLVAIERQNALEDDGANSFDFVAEKASGKTTKAERRTARLQRKLLAAEKARKSATS